MRIQRPPLRMRRRISPVRGSGREQALVKDLERRAAAQRLARAAVQPVLDLLHLFRRGLAESGAPGEVMVDQDVDVLVQAALPRLHLK